MFTICRNCIGTPVVIYQQFWRLWFQWAGRYPQVILRTVYIQKKNQIYEKESKSGGVLGQATVGVTRDSFRLLTVFRWST